MYNYPLKAVEELLSNAVYHRSYQIGEPITVRITPQELEITSFPGFDCSITDEDIRQHRFRARRYRNRRIGDFLKELRLAEGRNTGFPTTFEALEANGSPEPRFEMDANRGYLSVALPVHPAFLPDGRAEKLKQELEGDILAVSLTELARALGYKGISKRLSTTVDGMVASGKLERIVAPGGSRTKLKIR